MSSDFSRVWAGARPLLGTMIGVGILGLPFAVLQVGVVPGIGIFALVATLNYLILRLYGDLVLMRGGKARFIHVMGRELGHVGTGIASFAYIASIFGALLAYLIFGGQFLRVVLFAWLPMTITQSTMMFFLLASFLTIGGSLFVAKAQKILLPLMFCTLGVLMIVAFPHMTIDRFMTPASGTVGTAFSMMFFAFFGIAGIPESRDMLGRDSRFLPRTIALAASIVACMYAVFAFGMVATMGTFTTENAILGLSTIGSGAVLLASGVALCITATAFMNLSTALTNTFLYDVRMRFLPSWFLTMSVPLLFFFFGARHIASVLSVTGGVFSALTAIMVLIAYERARVSADLPKNSMRISQWIVGGAFVVLVVMMIGSV